MAPPEISSDPIAYWNGPAGEKWARLQDVMDGAIRPLGEAALSAAAPRPGERVVDVGCGCGDTTLALGERVGSAGRVIGVDVSAPMVACGRRRAEALAWVSFDVADATTWECDAGPFDLVYSRFGVMFFADPVAAFANLRRLLGPAGRLVFVCWRDLAENAWATVPLEALRGDFPEEPPPARGAPGPFAFADPARVESTLRAAGFADVRLSRFDMAMRIGDGTLDGAADFAVQLGPAGRLVSSFDDATKSRARGAVRARLEPLALGGVVALPAAVWIVQARGA